MKGQAEMCVKKAELLVLPKHHAVLPIANKYTVLCFELLSNFQNSRKYNTGKYVKYVKYVESIIQENTSNTSVLWNLKKPCMNKIQSAYNLAET